MRQASPTAIALWIPVWISLATPISAAAAEAPGAPVNLRCEYQTNPLGLDVSAPRLSWEVNDPRRGAVQTAYQVVVAETLADLALDDLGRSGGTCWDSGKVDSDQSIHVVYAGKTLESRRRYHWVVRTWDGAGNASPYSEPAFWEMALLHPADWAGRWIAKTEPGALQKAVELGQWIWHPEERGDKARVYFRRRFNVPESAKVTRALIRISADNKYTLFVNGKREGYSDIWKSFEDYEVSKHLQTGVNVVAVQAANDDGPCGMVLGMRIECDDKVALELKSDGTWNTAGVAPGGWYTPEFDDTGWKGAAVLGEYGCEPWGTLEAFAAERSVCLRKAFSVDGQVARARAYVTGLGLYDLSINGARAGNDTLNPGWTYYPKRIQYQVYDVGPLLRPGENVVGAVLGSGWWGAGMAGAWKDSPLRLMAQVEIEYADGRNQTVVTDDSWRAHESPVLEDSHYHGETYDARLEMPGWDAPGYAASDWDTVQVLDKPVDVLVAQYGPTIQVTEELSPVAVTEVDGAHVFDFGQNMSGRVRLKVAGAPEGKRIQIRFAEILLPDGRIYTDNYRSARATDIYFCKGGGEEVWEPRFTYRGFRYAELTGYPGMPDKDTLVARALHSAPAMAGTFECSNELINRIHRNIVWGQRSNMHSVPTDCPQRDERLGWTGDAQAFCATSCWNMEMARFYTKWLHDLTDSQHADGSMTDVAPSMWPNPASPAWGDVIAVQPWTVYCFYGDTRVIEENYNALAAWVEYMRANAKDGLLYEREGYGDWVAVVPSPNKPIGAAYYYYSTKLLAQMAAALGRAEDAAKYGALADAIQQAFNDAYLDKTANTYPGNTQTACVLPLYFGLVPEDELTDVFEHLVDDVVKHDYHLTTGFVGTAYLLPALTAMGRHDLAYRLAVQRTYPSWGHMAEAGGTTIWERWNSDRYEEVGPGMNSFNHFAFGSVGQWYYEALAGINLDPERPGFKHIILRPGPVGDLTWVRASYPSMYGTIRSDWEIKDGKLIWDVLIPANTTATAYIPAWRQDDVAGDVGGPTVRFAGTEGGCVVYEIGAGAYGFTVPNPVAR